MNLEQITRLETMVNEYHKTKAGYEDILSLIAYYIYRFPLKDPRGTQDDCGEFYLYFIPGLRRVLNKHKPGMRHFIGYLKQILKWRLSTYFIHKRRQKINHEVEGCQTMWDNENHETTTFTHWDEKSLCSIFRSNTTSPLKNDVDKRLLLASSLKYSSKLSEENWDKVINMTQSDGEWVKRNRKALDELVRTREKHYFTWITRRNKCYFKIRYHENILKTMNNPEAIKEMKMKIAKLWNTYNRMVARIANIRTTPSRSEISALLEIPKGTLDNSLFVLKQRLEKLDKAAEFRYLL